jgi:hypothetical protein
MNHNDNQVTQTANPTGVEARLARHGGLSYLHLPAVDVHQWYSPTQWWINQPSLLLA